MQTDVLIVGGGLSGLSLADHLARSGTDFRLVEAQDRLGGRILTENLSGAQFDLGPAWFWPGQPRMAAYASRFNLSVFEQFTTGDTIFQDRTGTIQRARGYASMQGSLRIDGGMAALITALRNEIDPNRIMLGTKLQSLTWQTPTIEAHLHHGKAPIDIQANHVVLALPPHVIAETIQFNPAWNAQQTAAMLTIPTWMAGQAKIIAVYDQPHWRTAGLSGDAMSQTGPMVEIHDASPPEGGPYALFGFVGVPPQTRAGHRPDLLQAARTQLAAMFGEAMSTPRHLILQDWAALPEIATAQDHAPAQSHPAYGLPPALQTIWNKNLHLASTETAPAFGGFLEGALEAAEAATQKLSHATPHSVRP